MARISVEEIVKQFKQQHPSSHIFKIEKFSVLRKHKIQKCESSVFSLHGRNCKLILYPNGKTWVTYINLDLEVEDSSSRPPGLTCFLPLKLFVLNQLKPGWMANNGLPSNSTLLESGTLIYISTFVDESQGYLLNDCCLFGVMLLGKIPPGRSIGTAECVTMIEKPANNKVTWKIDNFSALDQEVPHFSHEFIIERRKWKIEIHPKGDGEAKGNSISLYLRATSYLDNTLKANTYTKYKLRVLNQLYGKHHEGQADRWFPIDPSRWGFSKFMPLADLHDASKGYLVNDKLYLQVEIDVVSMTESW